MQVCYRFWTLKLVVTILCCSGAATRVVPDWPGFIVFFFYRKRIYKSELPNFLHFSRYSPFALTNLCKKSPLLHSKCTICKRDNSQREAQWMLKVPVQGPDQSWKVTDISNIKVLSCIPVQIYEDYYYCCCCCCCCCCYYFTEKKVVFNSIYSCFIISITGQALEAR
jgi:hypothetical protein